MPAAIRIINSRAPIRICDNGGWTDTWFARHGKIFNIAVAPHVEVQIKVYRRSDVPSNQRVTVYAENYAQHFVTPLDGNWSTQPLLEATIERVGVPSENAIHINIYSQMPPGASTGTSASVSVALIGALMQLNELASTRQQIAQIAHSVEVDMLRRQCGIQDQLSAVYGGINFIEMTDYPHATVTPLWIDDATLAELQQRLLLIYLGKTHDSSQVHEQVIAELERSGEGDARLETLRMTASLSADALRQSNLHMLGAAMIQNTNAQERLHAALISADARRVIEIAQAHHAMGWKVNGAGGEGGSLTVLCSADMSEKRKLISAIESASPIFKTIPIQLDTTGLYVWDSMMERGGK
jgi:D-glycero-alpha-D-manno-heptose-7-phosphate kinase